MESEWQVFCSSRLQDTAVQVSDSHSSFRDAAKFEVDETLRGVCFCPTEGKENVLAIVELDGHLTVLKLRPTISGMAFEVA